MCGVVCGAFFHLAHVGARSSYQYEGLAYDMLMPAWCSGRIDVH